MTRECVYKHPDGRQCQAPAMVGCEFCFFHDPESADRRKDASSAGGKATKPAMRSDAPSFSLRTPAAICVLIETLLNMLCKKEIDHRAANSVVHLANIQLRALKLKAEEERIGNLERLGQLDSAPDTAAESDVGSEPAAGVDGSQVPLRSIDDVCKVIEDTINAVLKDQVDPRSANAMGAAANAQLGLISMDLAERRTRLEVSEENRRDWR
jgi:hypothetical protein